MKNILSDIGFRNCFKIQKKFKIKDCQSIQNKLFLFIYLLPQLSFFLLGNKPITSRRRRLLHQMVFSVPSQILVVPYVVIVRVETLTKGNVLGRRRTLLCPSICGSCGYEMIFFARLISILDSMSCLIERVVFISIFRIV